MSCTCDSKTTNIDFIAQTDAIIEQIGTTRNIIIPLLQAVQNAFGYLPSEAIERIYEKTEIDRAQLISVATFYSQFKNVPYGQHIIKVCIGTACHVKGANNVIDAFRRELNIADDKITTEDELFSVEKIACLGCCSLAPVVQIDEKIYGHVMPGKVNEVIEDFIAHQSEIEQENIAKSQRKIAGEIRLGMGSCCQASGSTGILEELKKAERELGIDVDIKEVGCVGVCSKVPLIDVMLPDGSMERYPNVKPSEIKEILHHHFEAESPLKRWKNKLLNHVDTFHTDSTWDNVVWQPEHERIGMIDDVLSQQKHISTEGCGFLAPLNLEEYIVQGGFGALRKTLGR